MNRPPGPLHALSAGYQRDNDGLWATTVLAPPGGAALIEKQQQLKLGRDPAFICRYVALSGRLSDDLNKQEGNHPQ